MTGASLLDVGLHREAEVQAHSYRSISSPGRRGTAFLVRTRCFPVTREPPQLSPALSQRLLMPQPEFRLLNPARDETLVLLIKTWHMWKPWRYRNPCPGLSAAHCS